MNIIIDEYRVDGEMTHISGSIDGIEFYLNGIDDKVSTKPMDLTDEQINVIAQSVYDLLTIEMLSIEQ